MPETITTPCVACDGTGSITTEVANEDPGRDYRNLHPCEADPDVFYLWGPDADTVTCEKCGVTITIVAEDQTRAD